MFHHFDTYLRTKNPFVRDGVNTEFYLATEVYVTAFSPYMILVMKFEFNATKISFLWRVEKTFCEVKYFPANDTQCCGRKIASSKYKNKYYIRNGSERKIRWSVWRVPSLVPDTPWRITEDTVVDFIPAVTISVNRFIPTDRTKSVFFRIARSYPVITEPLRAKISRFLAWSIFF